MPILTHFNSFINYPQPPVIPPVSGPTFPRLGAMVQGQGNISLVSPAQNLAFSQRMDVLINLQCWPGWRDPVTGETMASVCQKIKNNNPRNTVLIPYVNNGEINSTYTGSPTPPGVTYEMAEYLRAHNAYAYSNGLTSSGQRQSWFSSSFWKINYTKNAPKFNGRNFAQWHIDWCIGWLRNGANVPYGDGSMLTQAANPYISGLYEDNVFFAERPNSYGIPTGQQCDYQLLGSVQDNSTTPNMAYIRQSMVAAATYFRQQWPGGLYMGNLDLQGYINQISRNPVGMEYDQVFNGMTYEGAMGQNFSLESFANFQQVMDTYNGMMDISLAPKLVVFENWFPVTDYQHHRYGLTAVLMNDGYFCGQYDASTAATIFMDEFNFDLGTPIDAAQRSPRYSGDSNGSGIWLREFTNGYAICAARHGAGDVTASDLTTPYASFTLPKKTQRLSGSQDSGTNNGAVILAGTGISMKPRDGLILKKI